MCGFLESVTVAAEDGLFHDTLTALEFAPAPRNTSRLAEPPDPSVQGPEADSAASPAIYPLLRRAGPVAHSHLPGSCIVLAEQKSVTKGFPVHLSRHHGRPLFSPREA